MNDNVTFFSIIICQKLSKEFGLGACVAMKVCLIVLNLIRDALIYVVAGSPVKKHVILLNMLESITCRTINSNTLVSIGH